LSDAQKSRIFGNKIASCAVDQLETCSVSKDQRLKEQEHQTHFEEIIMPHLDAAYNLARWLTRNEHDAQDVVQDAFLRAFKFFESFRGGNSRSWLLSIVRNTAYTWFEKNRRHEIGTISDEAIENIQDEAPNPEAYLLQHTGHQEIMNAIAELPLEFREAIILRELEEMSYKEIADVMNVPLGTVMSRLARARRQLQESLRHRQPGVSV
jgi:RNA polymerase sigma-70 factor (ECF subfamily)